MKFNKLVALLLASGFATVTFAAGQGSGTINFKGEIIDAPCTLDYQNANQTIEMGQVSNKELNKGKIANTQNPINIELKECSTETLKTVAITFDGAPDTNTDLLAINGSAKGAGIRLTNSANQLVKLGQAEAFKTLQEGNGNVLRFFAQLQGSDAASDVTPGNFTAVSTFSLEYK
ncbi:fimbrial protein [Neisseriaceae bacterium CLB008]|nr:type 1 fimbrial protein [Neisseriaceae bacterium]